MSDKVDGLSASLKDAQDNVASVKAQADQLSATLTDHAKSIATLTASAKELSSTLEDADGRLSKVEQTAQTNSSTLSDVQGDLSQVKQDATTLTATLKDAQGNISTLQQKADSVSAQLASAQGDIASLQTDVTGIKATLVSHEGDIHMLQADSKSLHDSMQDAEGDISTLKKTSTDVTSELKDHDGRISKTEQTAATLTNEFADQQGHLNRVEQTAQGTEQAVANQQGQINNIKTDAAGMHQTLTGQGNQIANINVTLNGLNTKYEGVSGDLNNLKSQAQWVTVTSAVDLNNVKTPCHEFLKGTVTNAPNEVAWWYLTVEGSESGRITQTVIADQSNNRYTRRWADSWSAWVKDATQTDVTALSNRITTNSTQITQNKQAIALKADQSTVNNLTGEVNQTQAQLKVQADQISSKVSSTDFKTLNDKVDGMKIGGRNLANGTDKEYTMGYGIPNTTWQNGYAYESLPTKILTGEILPQNDQFFANLVPGQEYTQTIWLETDADVKKLNAAITWFTNVGHDEQPAKIIKVGENSYKLFSTYTWPGKTDNNVRLFDIFYLQDAFDLSTGTYIKFGKLKLEEGNVSTDWTPAPEDLTTAIQKNATAIDQTNQKISLKADQTEVDQVKQTATQNSSRLDVMAGQISSKVTATDVNNIINGKGYATTSTVQSLITQEAGTINESIVKLDQSVKTGAENNVQLVRKSDFEDGDKGSWSVQAVVATDPPAELGQSGMKVLQTNVRDAYENDVWYSVKPGEKFDVDFWCKPSASYDSQFGLCFVDKNKSNYNWIGVYVNRSNQWNHYTGTITATSKAAFAKPWFQMGKDASNTTDTALLAKPSIRRQNDTTVAAIQQITASIDGLQSTVANKADKSQITQLSNVIQSKVSTSDFTSKVSQLSTDINARVTKGDLLSQINVEAGRTLIQSNKIYFDADSFVMSPNSKAFIPSAFITDLSADKITSGTLDAGNIRVINLTADTIHGGTLDVGDMNIKNLTANDITTGTLTGIDIKAGDSDNNFELKGQNIYWHRKVKYEYNNGDSFEDTNYGVIGQFVDKYFDYGAYGKGDALTIGDHNEIRMGLVGSYQDVDGSSQLGMQHYPKIIITYDDTFNPYEDRHQTGSLQNKQQICLWTTTKEFFRVGKTMGVEAHLDDTLGSKSTFNIQKDNCIGAYFGQGDSGNQINFAFGNNGSFNINGPLHVTGSKNSIVETRQGYLAINAYETAEYYFGDIGENNTGDTSQVVIGIDRIFNEVVNTDIQYQVFVTPYSNAHVWVEKRYNNRFIVKSDRPNAEFGWELKAKRKGYESNRLRRVNVDFKHKI
ncbi:gp58-like family protein [Limosilactobacillus vaginalis]|uniref:gp58-like family protein n=1 Tax=Limosilactobacillus vaginalis TaxID=1633 RepID=UPI003AAAD314